MTEEERLEREQIKRERNWVKARFNCTVETMFDELATVIEFDIRAFNRLSAKREVEVTQLKDGKITFASNGRQVSIWAGDKTIKVEVLHRGSQVSDFEVRPEWNEKTNYCDPFLDGEKVSTHLASQKIIGDLLFPEVRSGEAQGV